MKSLPHYTATDVRLGMIKSTNEYNDYLMRSQGGRTGLDLHEEWVEEMTKIKAEKSGEVREVALRDLSNSARFRTHFDTMARLGQEKKFWEDLGERYRVSNALMQEDAGATPYWKKLMTYGPENIDKVLNEQTPREREIKAGRKIFRGAGVPRGGNELLKGLAK